MTIDMLPKTKMELVVRDSDAKAVCEIIIDVSRSWEIGDGKIFITHVEEVIRVRTGERGEEAL